MDLFSDKFRNKVLQMTYRPKKGKKKFSPVKAFKDIESAIGGGIESLLMEATEEDDNENKKD